MSLSGRVRKVIKILRRKGFRRGLRFGVGASTEHEQFLGMLDCRTIVDIGANRGQFALAVRTLIPSAKVYSFEPLSAPAAKFRKLFAFDNRVVLHQVAIGPKSGTTEMHVSAADDSSSLLPITELKGRIHPGTAEINTQPVRVERLSSIVNPEEIESPALLKIDVQGFELESLKGCVDLLDHFTYVYVECSFIELYRGQAFADEVIEFLRLHGFALIGIHNLSYDKKGRAVEGDFLFTNRRGRLNEAKKPLMPQPRCDSGIK
jgi:FkbM family methyltransferase